MNDNVIPFPSDVSTFEECMKYMRDLHKECPIEHMIFVASDKNGHVVFGHTEQTAVSLLYLSTYMSKRVEKTLQESELLP